MKYMMMLFGDPEPSSIEQKGWTLPELVGFMHRFNDEISQTGELVAAEGLTHSAQGKTVQFRDGTVAVTDGPYGETREVLAGFWIVDVESEARVIELASKVVAFTTEPLEIRRIGDAPPEL